MKRELILFEEATGGGGQSKGEYGGALVGHGAGDWCRHVLEEDGVILEAALSRGIALLVRSHRVTENPVARLETGDIFADLDHLAREIGAQDKGILDPAENASDLDHPVEGVDGDCVVLDHDLVVTRRRVRCGLDLELGTLRSKPGGCICWQICHFLSS